MNIEKTISEHAVSDILTAVLDCQDRIVTEDVAPLFNKATGLDTPPASGSVTTTIEESRSVITAIIRKAWTATLTMLGGASVLSSIAAAYTYLRNRLQGNETYGIPDRRSEISASSPLAANLALLNDRKIGGVPEAVDGMSMARVLCDSAVAATITEITDDTTGWTKADSSMPNLMQLFPNLQSLLLRLSSMKDANICAAPNIELPELTEITAGGLMNNVANNGIVVSISLPKLKTIYGGGLIRGTNIRVLNCPELEYARCYRVYQSQADLYLCSNNPSLEEVYMPKLTYLQDTNYSGISGFCDCSKLKLWQVGKLEFFSIATGFFFRNVTDLIHFEIGAGTAISLNLQYWNPTNALDASRTDLIEEGSTAANNLEQFLSNFRDYIANRLTDNGSGKTLTLSQAVFSEIWDSQGQPQVKGDGLDELRADIHRIIRTDKQWAVNKA